MSLREKKQRQTRERILASARTLFCSRGIQSVSVSEIARVAEVGERTLYRYFPGKDDLLDELYLENLRSMSSELQPVEPPGEYVWSRGAELLDALLVKMDAGRRSDDFPANYIFDLLYNVYSLGRHADPTTMKGHVYSSDWYRRLMGADGTQSHLLAEMVSMLYGYMQRLVMLEAQHGVPDWDRVMEDVRTMGGLLKRGYIESQKTADEEKNQ